MGSVWTNCNRREIKGIPEFDQTAGGYKLHVGGIPEETTNDLIREKFDFYGTVKDVYVDSDVPRPFALVTFVNSEEAQKAGDSLNDM